MGLARGFVAPPRVIPATSMWLGCGRSENANMLAVFPRLVLGMNGERALTHIKPAKGVFCFARLAKAKCPAKQPAFNRPCKGNLECSYGKERCCGKTFPSLKFQCMSGTWVGRFTEACRSRRC